MHRAGELLCVLTACAPATDAPPTAPEPPRFVQVSNDPALHGQRLSKVLGCTGCHGDDLAGQDWSDEKGILWTANLTRSAHRWSDAELTRMITAGERPDRALVEMPSVLFAHLHPEDTKALVDYLGTLKPDGPVHPEPTFGPELKREIAAGTYRNAVQQLADSKGKVPPDLGPDHALGRHIVRATCVECHGVDLRGKPAPDPAEGGSPDLRMVASYSPKDFVTLMRTGRAAGNREVGLMSMVARRRYAALTDAEVGAVRSYLAELAARDP